MKKCAYCGKDSGEDSTHCLRCGTELGSAESSPAVNVPAPGCPKCGSLKYQPAISLQSSINPFVAHFGGLFVSIFYSASRKQRMRCLECGEFFLAATKSSRVALVLLVTVLFFIVLAIIMNSMR